MNCASVSKAGRLQVLVTCISARRWNVPARIAERQFSASVSASPFAAMCLPASVSTENRKLAPPFGLKLKYQLCGHFA
jgi:hypothetical protein